jgi:signal transduction histidine kinase
LVSLIDEKRQWFKSHHGLDATETPREYAFCGHAILESELFVVEDSHVDVRFQDNPLVTGDPNVRFYAGMPLITKSGHRIGTLCGIDHKPRALDTSQLRILEIVSRQVISQLELRRSMAEKDLLLQQQHMTLHRLESANQEVRDFVTVVAHDLRAPVLNAAGFSEELLASTDDLENLINRVAERLNVESQTEFKEILENDIRESARHIRRSAKQMDERITAIMLMARHGQRPLLPESVDLQSLVAESCAEHHIRMKQIGGTFDLGALPTMVVDRISVQLVVENLVANAVKYRDAERPLILRVSADLEADGISLHFTDNGRGIDKDDISAVFAMFRRVGQQNTDGDGTGLAYSRAIVTRLGGRVWVESVIGEGSSFHLYLPTDFVSAGKTRANSEAQVGS